MALAYKRGTTPHPDIIGYRIERPVPGMGFLFSSSWSVGFHRLPGNTACYFHCSWSPPRTLWEDPTIAEATAPLMERMWEKQAGPNPEASSPLADIHSDERF